MIQFEVNNYLALYGSEITYTSKLIEDFDLLVDHEIFHHALNIYHYLFMTVLYQTIFKIRECRKEKFEDATILISYRDLPRQKILETSLAFDFSNINERSFMDFLRLLDADENLVRDCKRLVNDRNDRSHANGNYFSDIVLFEEKISKYDNVLCRVHDFSKKFIVLIMKMYMDGLNSKSEITIDDLEIELLTPYRLSIADLFCFNTIYNLRLKSNRLVKQIIDENYDFSFLNS